MSRKLCDFLGEYEYANIAYNKGLLLFEAVRTAVGDDKFISGLQGYYKDNLYKVATPQSLYAQFTNGVDIEGIFNSFVEGKIII
jgi:aminopeptidase N